MLHFSGALLRRRSQERRSALFNLLAAAVRAAEVSLFIVSAARVFGEELLASVTEKFVTEHSDLLGEGVVKEILEPATEEHNSRSTNSSADLSLAFGARVAIISASMGGAPTHSTVSKNSPGPIVRPLPSPYIKAAGIATEFELQAASLRPLLQHDNNQYVVWPKLNTSPAENRKLF